MHHVMQCFSYILNCWDIVSLVVSHRIFLLKNVHVQGSSLWEFYFCVYWRRSCRCMPMSWRHHEENISGSNDIPKNIILCNQYGVSVEHRRINRNEYEVSCGNNYLAKITVVLVTKNVVKSKFWQKIHHDVILKMRLDTYSFICFNFFLNIG